MLAELWDKIKSLFFGLSRNQKKYAIIGGAIFGAGVFAGGIIMQAALAGLIINALLWLMLSESEAVMAFMRKYGGKIDMVLTISTLLTFGAAGITAALTMALCGAFFTVFRVLFCSAEPDKKPKPNPNPKKETEVIWNVSGVRYA